MTDTFDADVAANVREALDEIEADLLRFEARARTGEVNASLVHAIFRHAHNIKGLLLMLEARAASALVHEVETHFDAVRNGAACPPPPVLDRCLDAVDAIRQRLAGQANAQQITALTAALGADRAATADADAEAERTVALEFPLPPAAAERLQQARAAEQRVYQVDKVVGTALSRADYEQLPIYEDIAALGTHLATHPRFEHLPRHADETVVHILFATQMPEDELALRIFDPYRPLADEAGAPGAAPTDAAPADAAPEPAAPSAQAAASRPEAPLRVLVVEDDFVSRFTLREMLAEVGTCEVAVNGKEALAAFKMRLDEGQPYDLVCLDIMMPEMDGHETIKRLRATEAARGIHGLERACVVMTTALSDVEHVMAAFSQQADAYLVKPIDFDALRTQLQKLGLGASLVSSSTD